MYRPKGPGSSAFVGRQREMGKLKAVLEHALFGQGRLLMLVGEPGIGKTRTAQELAAYAETLGAQVLRGWCYEEEGAPPFWPWVQPIRAYVQERAERLQSEMGPGAADIAEVVSEVRAKLPNLEPPLALPPEQARFRLFDSITTFLKKAAQSQPLMLVLDDLHWADKPSLLLLQFLARQLGESHLLVLGCYRDMELSRQHPLSESLAQLSRLPVFQRELLLGMSREDTGQFIEMTAGVRPSPQLVETIHARTEGNPFFTAEVVRLLSERGALQDSAGLEAVASALPVGVLEVIGRRLNRLSSQCHQTLTTAAVIGREFDFRLLNLLSERTSEEQLLNVIDEGLEAHLIEEMPEGRERYQFCHALIQETLTQQLSSSRKVRQHARIAQVLEKRYEDDTAAHAAELAYHFAEAQTVLGTKKLVKYSMLAGDKALASYAWEEAEAYFQRGMTAKGVSLEGTETAKDAEAAALLFGLGRARLATVERLRVQTAVEILSRAFGYYEAVGDVTKAAAIAEYPLPPTTVGRTGVASFISRALKLVPADSLQAGRLLSTYVTELGRVENDYEGAQEASQQALAIACRDQDLALEVRTLAASADVDFFHLHLQEALEKARRAIALAWYPDDRQAAWSAHWNTSYALWLMGESREAQQQAAAALELAEQLHGRYRLTLSLRANATLYRLLGDWRRARDFSDRGLAVGPQEGIVLGDRVLLEYELGDFEEGERHLRRLLLTIPQTAARPGVQYAIPAQVIPGVARITGVLDRLDVAVAAAQTLLSSPFAAPLFALFSKASQALLAVLRCDMAVAAEQHEAMKPWRGLMLWATCSDRLLGLLAHTMGDLDQATKHFEDALAFCRQAGYRPELAWSLCDYADVLTQRATTDVRARHPSPLCDGDRAKAVALLGESLAIATELGMRPLTERVVALQERAQAQSAKTPAYLDGLTQREVEVLRLIALGKSNPEIAQELFISSNTVAHHVTNILNKTNTANRTEAATYAAQHGLIQG